MKETLKISEIQVDDKLYPRNKINEVVVKEYAKAMDRGDVFPLPYVALYKKKYILVDGLHRIEAKKVCGERYMECDIKTNFPDTGSIYLAAIKANAKHGLRLKKGDWIRIGNTLRSMGYVTEDIARLTGLQAKVIEKKVLSKVKKMRVLSEIKRKQLPKIIKEKIRHKEFRPIISKAEERLIEETNRADWQVIQLREILEYIKSEEFDTESKKVCKLIERIKHWLKKRYPKL